MNGDAAMIGNSAPIDTDPAPPPTCGVAFKEWAGVCAALASGQQSLILRKGGVAEVGGEFRPDHPAFWLYPTAVHQAEQGLRTPREVPPIDPHVATIDTLAVVEWAGRVARLDQLDPLAAWHDWTGSTIRGRFMYRQPGLWALVVRIYHRATPWAFAVTPEQLGCKTWVPLHPAIATAGVAAVLDEAEAARRRAAIRHALETTA